MQKVVANQSSDGGGLRVFSSPSTVAVQLRTHQTNKGPSNVCRHKLQQQAIRSFSYGAATFAAATQSLAVGFLSA
jgi:hypothetical protein